MNHNKLGPFLNAVFDLAKDRCGTEFEEKVTEQRISREKFLQGLWGETKPSTDRDAELVYREIDFDTIVNMSITYLDELEFARFLKDLANLALHYGQIDKAREVLKRILRDHTESVSPAFVGSVNQMLGDAALHQSELDTAAGYFKRAKDIFLENGDELRYAGALNAEGVIYAEKGQTQASYICFKDAHSIAESLDNKDLTIQTSMNLANLAHTLGNFQESLVHLHSTSLLIEIDDSEMLAKLNHNLGITYKALHHANKSLECFDQAILLAEQSHNHYLRMLSFLEKSEVLSETGDVQRGSAMLTTAFQAFSEFGDRLGMADAYKVFGIISGRRDSEKLALAFFNNSLRIANSLDNIQGAGETHMAMAKFFMGLENREEALASYRAARASFDKMEAPARVSEIDELLNNMS